MSLSAPAAVELRDHLARFIDGIVAADYHRDISRVVDAATVVIDYLDSSLAGNHADGGLRRLTMEDFPTALRARLR